MPRIPELQAATVPLEGTELVPIEAAAGTRRIPVDDLFDRNGRPIKKPQLQAFTESLGNHSLVAGTLTLNLAAGNNFAVTLDQNVTAVEFSGVPASGQYVAITIEFAQDATGGRTVAGWPAGTKWPGGTAPTITAAAGSVDIITGYTRDGGTTYRLGRAHADSK